MYLGEERCIQGFGGETRGKEPTWKTDGKIIFRWIFKKRDARGHGLDRSGSG